ncbi:hypothetical protein cand_006770 [Cryptosporidium andersoni]|uniref:Uncharacterized protein n=1 Tax=Cryptosporidium andersoni TaxID=117008 RepID=A0A1J4MQD8_9CRYT|nr:hypothetical protein cand_006770 [Cryptosporidium andersoni]
MRKFLLYNSKVPLNYPVQYHILTVRSLHNSKYNLGNKLDGPKWGIDKKGMYQPTIPDRYYIMGSQNINYPLKTLELRAMKRLIEEIINEIVTSLKSICNKLIPILDFTLKHNPDGRYQLIAILSFIISLNLAIYYDNESETRLFADLIHYRSLLHAKILDFQGFWRTKQEDLDHRVELYNKDYERLTKLWESAIIKAKNTGKFETLCSYLQISEVDELNIPETYLVRLDNLPYGENNNDTFIQTAPQNEKVIKSFSLNFTYNNLLQNWGDHINRVDNKSSILRPKRLFFSDIYIPPTK